MSRKPLTRLYRDLDARERVLLMHRGLLEDSGPDPEVRRTTPPDQYRAANRYVGLANAMLHVVVPWALSLSQEAEILHLRAVLAGMAGVAREHGAEVPQALDDAVLDGLRRELPVLEGRLSAVVQVVADIEQEFQSDAVTPPIVRDLLVEAADYAARAWELVPGLPDRPEQPDEATLSELRAAVRASPARTL